MSDDVRYNVFTLSNLWEVPNRVIYKWIESGKLPANKERGLFFVQRSDALKFARAYRKMPRAREYYIVSLTDWYKKEKEYDRLLKEIEKIENNNSHNLQLF